MKFLFFCVAIFCLSQSANANITEIEPTLAPVLRQYPLDLETINFYIKSFGDLIFSIC